MGVLRVHSQEVSLVWARSILRVHRNRGFAVAGPLHVAGPSQQRFRCCGPAPSCGSIATEVSLLRARSMFCWGVNRRVVAVAGPPHQRFRRCGPTSIGISLLRARNTCLAHRNPRGLAVPGRNVLRANRQGGFAEAGPQHVAGSPHQRFRRECAPLRSPRQCHLSGGRNPPFHPHPPAAS